MKLTIAKGALASTMLFALLIAPAIRVSAETTATTAAATDVAPATSPLTEIKQTIDKIVDIVAQYPGEEKATERRSKLRELIAPKFDFEQMSKLALGTHWNDISKAEQDEYVTVFSDLLAKTYLNRLDEVEKGMVDVNSERIVASKSLVKTVVHYKGDTFPIDYKLLNQNGKWRVYDVIIENIGLVANYRNEFSGIIRKETFAGLMKRLREKSL